METISMDAKATLLLVSRLRQKDSGEAAILTPTEFDTLLAWMDSHSLSLSDLLNADTLTSGLDDHPEKERVESLMSRRLSLSAALESWRSQAIGVLCAKDSAYPVKWLEKLKRTPPIVFYAGNIDLRNRGGVAIAGSRNIDGNAEDFTRKLAKTCAELGFQVISGGAKGVDQIALASSLENGGTAIAVLADSLSKVSLMSTYREYLRDGSLLLLSPYDPEAHFMVGNAMARNKLIYSLADFAVVVSAETNSGGTWAGATENMKNGWAPLYVRSSDNSKAGNKELVALGATPLDEANAEDKDYVYSLWKQSALKACDIQETHQPNDQQILPLF